jgi:hypothetical protein
MNVHDSVVKPGIGITMTVYFYPPSNSAAMSPAFVAVEKNKNTATVKAYSPR